MRSWVLLLLSAALLRLGNAEVRLKDVQTDVMTSEFELNAPEEEDEHDTPADHTHGRYARSLVAAQPAQQAICKVRTEVMEVKRSMLDRRNADFILWPPCVEVQRCSGCCNNRLMKCVPIVTSSRNLQVIKIQYVNMKPKYEQAIITVEDHVTCRPSRGLFSPGSQKTLTSKADLHRHDDLKHNQQEQPVAKQVQRGSYTHWTQPRLHQSPAHMQPGVYQHTAAGPALVNSQPPETRTQHGVTKSTQQVVHGSGYDGKEDSSVNGTKSSGEMRHPDHMQRQQELLQHQQRQQLHYPQQTTEDQVLRTQSHLNAPQSDSASPPVSPTQPLRVEQTPAAPTMAYQKDSVSSGKYVEVTHPREPEAVTTAQKERKDREESGSSSSGDTARVELASQVKDRDSKISSGSGHLTEEERKQKIVETVQRELDKESHLHPHPPQQRPRPTFKSALPTVAPRPSSRRSPFRPASPRRRRKHRKRISKEAMRAMIM
ncbi:hypothetical protein fugu_007617 [Takifugu bimaculatus]|uniref:Platelet-derived growth factor (PDGF) family profile domain-containing protein n=1 Tax=Takifugu bimaculatus TaxID=433685 RepID=A0A4Z2B0Z4_9TELE|nr:hypothetical protein fugu_007617 [Takifugu bimaculatus]